MPETKPTGAPATDAAPLIDRSAGMRMPDASKLSAERGGSGRPWAADFVANLGQGADAFHPNNRAKVELPLAARMAKALAPLPKR